MVTELKNRGVQDIFIACVDGLKGFPDAIEAMYPKAAVQLCIVHMVRYSLNYVGWKLRKEVAADLRAIYTAHSADEAQTRLNEFDEKWGADYPAIVKSWRSNWARIIPFFDYPPEIRRVIYTTNAIESVNMSLRKVTKNRGSFPNDDSLLKLFYLAINNISKKWTIPCIPLSATSPFTSSVFFLILRNVGLFEIQLTSQWPSSSCAKSLALFLRG